MRLWLTEWLNLARGRTGWLAFAVLAWICAVGQATSVGEVWAASPGGPKPKELTGPASDSYLVPPVRSTAPSRTKTITRPSQYDQRVTAGKQRLAYRMESLRLAIDDLIATFGEEYEHGLQFRRRWRLLSQAIKAKEPGVERRYQQLRDESMLANPLVDVDQLLVLKRKRGELGLPTNHQCNTSLPQAGYDNELAILSPVGPQGRLQTLYRPEGGKYVGEMDLHFDGQRLLFTMPNGRTWQIHEMSIDGGGLRQVSQEIPDTDNFDSCYLPDGRIVYASTASFTGVPCWHGKERACCLYLMNADGSGVRQLCYDQDLDLHPSVLPTGQIIYSRWDYTGLLHAYVRPLMSMNPDGTGQRAVYGSNSYYPNCLFYPRAVPGNPNRVVAILAGYHGKNRMGELAVLDISQGWNGESGVVHRITHRDEPIVPVTIDRLTVNAPQQFLHPYPLSEKYILTAMQPGNKQPWGIYLVDIFDNVTPIVVDPAYDFFEPIPVTSQPKPAAVPDRVDLSRDDAVVVLHDIYRGPGLAGVPRGTIKSMRIAAYHFGYPGMAGPDKVGRGGPWEVMRILGTVPVYEDGSARFRVPANTPITLQALDAEGKAVQLMRSWYTAMPGETTSCVGCHETPREAPAARSDMAAAMPISEIRPWYGPPRGFDFAREVQPVLDQHCVTCHDGQPHEDSRVSLDLRDEELVDDYIGLPLTNLGATRLESSLVSKYPERFSSCEGMPYPYGQLRTHYTPAYEALIPFIRRVNIEDAAGLLNPGEYHADTSELIQMLRKGHHGVRLDAESWDRLVTWIDLNGPCHGTWSDIAEVPNNAAQRRHEIAVAAGGLNLDPETVPVSKSLRPLAPTRPLAPALTLEQHRRHVSELLRDLKETASKTDDQGPFTAQSMILDLGEGLAIELVHVPAGRFVMGDLSTAGAPDEQPAATVNFEHGFWIGKTEVTNAQFRRFLPRHSSGWFTKRQIDRDGPGIELDKAEQPAVRVSWRQAAAFCDWLSRAAGCDVTLPSEAQWEYAARAGTVTPLSYGDLDQDFSSFANMADRSLACLYEGTAGLAMLQPIPSEMRSDDQAIGTAAAGAYQPNPWGLHDMHGNAAEWTRTSYAPYPYDADDGRNSDAAAASDTRRVVRGGSFYDRPHRCRSSHRRDYPAWQAVHDVGFRIVVEKAAQ